MIASNHVGYLDFAFVALSPPRPRRRVRFVARHDLHRHRIAGPLLRGLGQIDADPFGDARETLAAAVETLRRGEVVGIHPEGTISPSFVPRRGRTGAVRMAQAAGAPVVPCAVWGSQRLLTKWRPRSLQRGVAIRVVYGEPYHPEGDPRAATDQLMRRIASLVDLAAEAYPQMPAGPDDRWWLPAARGGTAPTPADAEERLARQRAERRARRQAEDGIPPGA